MKDSGNQMFLASAVFCRSFGAPSEECGVQMILVGYKNFIDPMKRENAGTQKGMPKFCF